MIIKLCDLAKLRLAMVEEGQKWSLEEFGACFVAFHISEDAASHYQKSTEEEAREYIQLRILSEGLRRIGVHLEEPL